LILQNLLPVASADLDHNIQPIGGRPEKQTDVIRAYEELGLMTAKLTRKEELRRIEEHLQKSVSLSTLNRSRRVLLDLGIEKDNKLY
jgi:hypothetical protein